MKPAAFEYRQAHTLDEAVALLGELGEGAKALAGGQSLLPMMHLRLARPSALVDLNPIEGLSYLRPGPDGLAVGALTRHCEVEACRDPAVLAGWGILPRAVRWIGHHPIRVRGTIGGSMAHADPAAEWPMLALLLEATFVVAGASGERLIPASAFFVGFLATALEESEVVVEVRFPPSTRRCGMAEFARRSGDFALVAAGVCLDVDGGACRGAGVVVAGVDATPLRLAEAEAVLIGATLDAATLDAAAEAAGRAIEPGEDIHASARYRRHLTRTLVRRSLAEALADAH